MAAITKPVAATPVTYVAADNEVSTSIRCYQNAFLSELPGVAFAFLTLGYIVSRLIAL